MSRVKPTSLRHFPTHCENSRGAGTATWRLNTSREDFRFSLVLLVEREKYNSLTSSFTGARRLSFAPGEGSWTRTKKPIKAPDLLSVSLAVSVFRTKTHFCSVPVRLPFRQSTHIYKPDKFADLRHTPYNLQPYSITGETSLSFRERP